jgi:hypothetical protein
MSKLNFLLPLGLLAIEVGLSAAIMMMPDIVGMGAVNFRHVLWILSFIAASCSIVLAMSFGIYGTVKCLVSYHSK